MGGENEGLPARLCFVQEVEAPRYDHRAQAVKKNSYVCVRAPSQKCTARVAVVWPA